MNKVPRKRDILGEMFPIIGRIRKLREGPQRHQEPRHQESNKQVEQARINEETGEIEEAKVSHDDSRRNNQRSPPRTTSLDNIAIPRTLGDQLRKRIEIRRKQLNRRLKEVEEEEELKDLEKQKKELEKEIRDLEREKRERKQYPWRYSNENPAGVNRDR